MGILSTGSRALLANQMALQTAGNNIANVNTPGYSRQKVIMNTVEGQFTGAGYIGNGVTIETIQRNFSDFLTRQATLAGSTQSADSKRFEMLKQIEGIFESGSGGLGAAISDMLNAFSDVATAPTDLTARTVVLTRMDETAARMRASSQRLDDLVLNISQELEQKTTAINSLTKNIAAVNGEIVRSTGNGQTPNDLLDQREQLIRELNQYVQTTSIPADDGSVGLVIAGSQSIVLGSSFTPVSIVTDDYGDNQKSKLAITRNGQTFSLDENSLAGGEVSGLLRFQNTDLVEARNLLGRLTTSVTTAMNEQHKLGLDLNGNVGGNLFTPTVFNTQNVREPAAPAKLNTGTMTGANGPALSINDVTQLVPSDYEMVFTTGTSGTITRRSDGMVITFPQVPAPSPAPATLIARLDGLDFDNPTASAPNTGDRFLFKPFSTSATAVSRMFSTPRALAVASPVAGSMGASNKGSLQQVALVARSNPVSATPVVLTFTGATSYTRSDEVPPNTTTFTFTPGQAIQGTTPTASPLEQWSLTLQGNPVAGDTVTIKPNAFPATSAGNANAMLGLRDLALFDGGPLTDGYAGLISQIGIRTQSAGYAANVSSSIAASLEKDRTGISGVNLDEEAAKLLQYQQAYQASAKMIQIAQSIFDTLMQGMGR
jgi:flagellar hook-associated protein 1 FlgK